MSAAWTSFKLGLFTLVVAGSIAVIALTLGLRPGPERTVRYRTYFDQSVVGLEVGALVKYRGVTIGAVDAIGIGPDGRIVEVRMKVDAARTSLIAWRPEHDNGLRAKVGSPGLTGVKLIDLEYVDPLEHPPPKLPFAMPERYLPSAPSSGVEESLAIITDALVSTLHRVEGLVEDVDTQDVPERMAEALGSVGGAATELRRTVRRVDRARLPDRTADTIARLDTAIGSMQRVLERVDADGGVLAGAERVTESVDTLGRRATGTTDELDRTLRDLGDAARTMRSLGDALERDPDMLLKGHKKGTP